jgi:hypothetical protein
VAEDRFPIALGRMKKLERATGRTRKSRLYVTLLFSILAMKWKNL